MQREGDVEEGAQRRGAEVARRVEDGEVEGLEPGVHRQDDERQADQHLADRRVDQPLGRARERKNTASEIPMTSSGTTAGSRLAVSSPPRAAGRFSFIRPKAKAAPTAPAAIAETAARMRLFLKRDRDQRIVQRTGIPVEREARGSAG